MRWAPLLLVGCWTPPDLPLVDEVPIVANDRCAPQREATVACVLDGDTFDIGQCGDAGERIRMLGINAPEIAHPPDPTPAECWGDNAASELRRRIEGRRVILTFDASCEDLYGRTLAYVWLDVGSEQIDDGAIEVDVTYLELINQSMVLDGHARIYGEEFGDILYQPELEQARDLAEALGRGLWGACPPG